MGIDENGCSLSSQRVVYNPHATGQFAGGGGSDANFGSGGSGFYTVTAPNITLRDRFALAIIGAPWFSEFDTPALTAEHVYKLADALSNQTLAQKIGTSPNV